MNERYKPIMRAAKAGGKILLKHFGQKLKVREKSTPADLVTKADIESDKKILSILSKSFPDYNILTEENGMIDKKSDYTFIVDGLDGTNNFVLDIPYFSVSIGLVAKNHRRGGRDEIIFGVIHNPVTNDTFWAEKNKGAYLNNKKVKVNKIGGLKRITVSWLQGYRTPPKYFQNAVKKLTDNKAKRVLVTWSVALDFCLLASGKIEAIIHKDVELHDYVAGKLIASEAGAVITDFKGKEESNELNNTFLVANRMKTNKEILKIL